MNDDNLLRFACPHCQKRVKISADLAGQRFPCPNPSCRQPIDVPRAEKPADHKPRSTGFDVFLSYSNKDKKWADAACAALEARQIRCWIAPRDIVPGREWGAAIIEGIDACRVMVLVFSAHANESPQVRREVERAISKGMAIVPLRVENVKPAGAMEYALSNTHWLDAFKPPIDEKMPSLVAAVQGLLAGGPVAHARVAEPATRSGARWVLLAFLLAGSAFACLACAGLGFVGYRYFPDGKSGLPIAKGEGTKDTGTEAKPKGTDLSPVLVDEDFHKAAENGWPIPRGWTGDGFRVVTVKGRHALEVSKAAGTETANVPLPKPLRGDFSIEGKYHLTSSGYPTFGVTLEDSKSKAVLPVVFHWNGQISLAKDVHQAVPGFTLYVPVYFHVKREANKVLVFLDGQIVSTKDLPAAPEYDMLSLSLSATNSSLSSIKVTAK